MSENTIRIVLVDDDPLVRAGLGLILGGSGDIDVVGEASDGVEAQAVVAEAKPDVVLMDIRMPRRDGIAATAEEAIRAHGWPGNGRELRARLMRAVEKVCADLVRQARAHFTESDAIMARNARRVVRAPRIMSNYYHAILDKLVARGFAPPPARLP